MTGNSFRRRPYRVECTGSLLTSEVKRRRARLVLGWGTAREDLRVLSAIYIPMHRDQLLLTQAPYTQGAVIFRKLFHYNIAEYDCVLALTSLASRPASSPNLHFLVLPPNPFQSLSATPQNLQSQNTNQLTITNTKTTKHEALTQPKKNLKTLSQQSEHLKISKPQNKTLTPSRKTPSPQTQALKLQNDHPKPKTTPKTRKHTKSQIPSVF